MGTTNQRVKGAWQEAKGKVKKTVGGILERPNIESEGRLDETLGRARQGLAKAAERAREKLEDVAGAVVGAVGKLASNGEAEARGQVKSK